MIGATYPAFALLTGSVQSLTRSLSNVVPVVAESPSPIHRHQYFPLWKAVTHLPSLRFTRSSPRDQPQKPIQYPETRPGSVQ